MSIKTVNDIVTEDDGNTIVIFSKFGETLDLRHIGESRSGDWKIKDEREFKTVVIYFRNDVAKENIIFKGEFSRYESSQEKDRKIVVMNKVKNVGITDSNWTAFNTQNTSNPCLYMANN